MEVKRKINKILKYQQKPHGLITPSTKFNACLVSSINSDALYKREEHYRKTLLTLVPMAIFQLRGQGRGKSPKDC